jgi:hypothetical protein
VGVYLLDGFLQPNARHKEFIDHLKAIELYSSSIGIEKIYLVSGHGENIEDCPFEYFYLDYNLRLLVNSYKVKELPRHNNDNNKFLFLTGMPDRPNRIGLLSRYYDRKLLDQAEWSFFAPWTNTDKLWCRNYLNHYTDQQFNQFLTDCERSFDTRYQTAKAFYGGHGGESDVIWHDVVDIDWVKDPTYIDSKVYSATAFSVISEGPNFWNKDNFFITEKTWRTILHRHSFIFAGEPDQFRYIKQLGYRTFENYMLIKDYAYIEDENTRLDAVVTNTKYFLETYNQHAESILADLEYNYNRFFYHVEKQNNLLDTFKNELRVPEDDIKFYFESTGYNNIIRRIPDGF